MRPRLALEMRGGGAARVARHWLILAIATVLSLAVGARLEEAAQRGLPPGRLCRPRSPAAALPRTRRVSLFARGRAWLHLQVLSVLRWCSALWLWLETLPALPADVLIIRHVVPPLGLHA